MRHEEHFWKSRELSETYRKHKTKWVVLPVKRVDLSSGVGNVLLYGVIKKYWAHGGKLSFFTFSRFPITFTEMFCLLPSMPLTKGFPTPKRNALLLPPSSQTALNLPWKRSSTDPRRASEPGIGAASPPALGPLSTGTREHHCPTPNTTRWTQGLFLL